MRIEEISKELIEKMDTNGLYQLRLRSKQFFDKYTEFEKENLFIAVDWDDFFDRYEILISEFRNRNIKLGKWSLDEELRKRTTKAQDFYIRILGSMAESHSALGKHFSLLISHKGKNVLIDPAVHRSSIDENVDAVIITQSDKDYWEYVKEYDKIPVYSIGAVLDKLPPNDFHPILKPLTVDGLTLRPIKTTHKVGIPSMGVRADVGSLGFSIIPEFMTLTSDAKNLIKETIWLVGVVNYDEDDETAGKLSFRSLMELAKELKPEAIYLTNLRKDLLKHEDEVNEALKEWKGKILKDNDVLKYEDFVKTSQKSEEGHANETFEIDALVVGKHRIAQDDNSIDVYNYVLAVGEISSDWAGNIKKEDENAVIEFKGKFYQIIGKSDNTNQDVAKGSILRVTVEDVNGYETENPEFQYYKTHAVVVMQPVPEKDKPDEMEVLERLSELVLQKGTLKKEGIEKDVKISIQNKEQIQKPYPNEHACRIHDPKDLETPWGRNEELQIDGKPVSRIYGSKKGHPVLQAYRYKVDQWTAGQAETHCNSVGGNFEISKLDLDQFEQTGADDKYYKQDIKFMNSPTLAHLAVYGETKELQGRSDHKQQECDGIEVDEHLKCEWIKELNTIPEIEMRASCEGHDKDRISYVVFRLKNKDASGVVQTEMNKLNGIHSLMNVGNQGEPRIVVAGKTFYGESDWEGWWSSLAGKIKEVVGRVIKLDLEQFKQSGVWQNIKSMPDTWGNLIDDHHYLHTGYYRLKKGEKWGNWTEKEIIEYHAAIVSSLRKYNFPMLPTKLVKHELLEHDFIIPEILRKSGLPPKKTKFKKSLDIVSVNNIRHYKDGYEVRTEEILTHDASKPKGDTIEMKSAYTVPDGNYIGDSKTAHFLCTKKGIKPEKSKPDNNVCSIGFCEKEQKWYGWSHRALYGFTIKSTCKKGDCHYQPANKADFIEDCTLFWNDDNHIEITSTETIKDGDAGVYTSWKYDDTIKNEKLRGTIGGVFTRFPDKFGRGEWEAKTLSDAKQMAIDFAEGVS